jgi:hypothetical protein
MQQINKIVKSLHTDPNSVIHFSYLSRGTACADDFVVSIESFISSEVIGPGMGTLFGSTASAQFV